MQVTHNYLAVTFFGFAASLSLGCGDSSGPAAPTTGAIQITVSTVGVDRDADGYTVTIDGGRDHWVGSNTTVTFGALPRGTHFVRLDGVLANCLVDGTNPRAVDVAADKAAVPVSFSVLCVDNGEPPDSDW